MSKPSAGWMACCCRSGFLSCALLLSVAVTLLYLGMIPLVIWWQGAVGLQPAGVAALLSLLVGLVVLAINHHASLRERPLVAMLAAMGVRMTPLLATSLLVAFQADKGEYIGFIGYLVVFYLATLAVETFVSVQLAQAHHTTKLPAQGPQA